MAIMRTVLLLGLLTGILLAAGFILAGTMGMTLALVLAFAINFISYWYSDKIVLKIYRAKPTDNKKLHSMIEKLSKEAEIPKPKLYVIDKPVPNAFATGRNPKHAAVAVTNGLLEALTNDEIEGVLAHELSHIKNRDTLIATLSATIGGAVAFLARIAWWSMFMGDRRNNSTLVLFPLIIFAPIAAMLVQLGISRGREYHADYTGATISKKPLALASALKKISDVSNNHPMKGSPASANLWIVNPLKSNGFTKLFSTHPPVEERVKRLNELSKKINFN